MTRITPSGRRLGAGFGAAAALCAACAPGSAGGGALTPLPEAEWRSLAHPRPTPLPGAVRLAIAEIELSGDPRWPREAPVPSRLGLTELVTAGLLRRADVQMVERRRFATAAEAARSGRPRPAGAPPVGVSPGAQLTATVAWLPLPTGEASLEVRLIDTATGRVVRTARSLLPGDAEPVGLARTAVGTILSALAALERLPAWDDPVAESAPPRYTVSGVPPAPLTDFLRGLAAEEQWRWEAARLAYQSAARSRGFFEAETALARTARLRLGGTLGES